MTLLSLSDLFLDTNPYGSHTVASDAMYTSLPLLTLPSESFASRVGLSLLSLIGLDTELVTHSRKDLTDVLYKLLVKNVLLVEMQRRVGLSRGRCIFNSGRFTSRLEWIYQSLTEFFSHEHFHLFFDSSVSACSY